MVGLALTTAGGDVEVGVVACGDDVGLLDDGKVVGIYRSFGESVVAECPIAYSNVFACEDLEDGCNGAEIEVAMLSDKMDMDNFSIEWHICFYLILGAKIHIKIYICKDLIRFL